MNQAHLPSSAVEPAPAPVRRAHRRPFYPALDGLRTVAVAMVILVHYVPSVFPIGWIGVQVFFVLSGFLITGILFDTADEPFRFRNFYARRTLRIFPLYYGFLLGCLLLTLATRGNLYRSYLLWPVYLENFAWVLTRGRLQDVLVTGGHMPFAAIGHLWSLAIEEQFYLLWPLLVFHVRDRRTLMRLCWVLIGVRLVLAAVWQVRLSPATLDLGLTYRMLPTQWDGFLMGGLLALWLRGGPRLPSPRRAGLYAGVAAAGYAAVLLTLHAWPAILHGEDVFDYRSGFQAVVGLPLINAVSTVLILAAVVEGSWLYWVCSLRPMRSLGKVSYGIYVFHLPAFVFCSSVVTVLHAHGLLPNKVRTLGSLLGLMLTLALAYSSFYLYERRFLLLKRRFDDVQPTSG